MQNVITISDCPITDSIFDIKNALEEPSICRVRKIFAVHINDIDEKEPPKKCVFIWVEWTNTNASWIFSAQLRDHGEKLIFKLDRWDQPICTQINKYGNAIAHAHWICRPSSREQFIEAELLHGNRNDYKIWSKFISLGESEEVSDNEQEEVELAEEETVSIIPIPKLERQKPQLSEKKSNKAEGWGLSLILPEKEEQDYDEQSQVQASWSEILGFEIQEPEENSSLSRKELYLLGCGKMLDLNPEFIPMNKEVSCPFPTNNFK
jgi:hypothetical protein